MSIKFRIAFAIFIQIFLSEQAFARYLQADPIGINGDYSDPVLQAAIKSGIPLNRAVSGQLNHPYNYARNNPVKYIDPFGLLECDCIAKPNSFSYPRGDAGGKYCNYSCTAKDGTRFELVGPANGDQCRGAHVQQTVTPSGDVATYADIYNPFNVDTERLLNKLFGKSLFDTAVENSYNKAKGQ